MDLPLTERVLKDERQLEIATENEYQINNDTHRLLLFLTPDCRFCKLACKKLAKNVKGRTKIARTLIFCRNRGENKHFFKGK